MSAADDHRPRKLAHRPVSSGTCVILSRTDPLIDPVLTNGRVRSSAEDKIPVLRGSVYTTSRGLIKVFFESSIEDLTKGQWRWVQNLLHED